MAPMLCFFTWTAADRRPITDNRPSVWSDAGTQSRSDALSGIGSRRAVSGRPVSGVARVGGEAQRGSPDPL